MGSGRIIFSFFLVAALLGCAGREPEPPADTSVRVALPAGSVVVVRSRADVSERESLLVPESAVFRRGVLEGVYVVDAEGRADVRWIRTGKRENAQIRVIGGLDEGEKIVARPVSDLGDGVRVEERAGQDAVNKTGGSFQ